MGLAASQCRLLLLTARKNSVEAQMMTISNQKLSMSRKMAEVSEKYNNALNSKKLTWGSSNTAISFNLLMYKNPTVGSSQYILTDSASSAVILDSAYASKLGLSAASGSASDFKNKCANVTTFFKKIGLNTKISSKATNAYYTNIFNALAKYGWKTNSGASKNETLQAQILNGNYTLKKYASSNKAWNTVSSSATYYPLTEEDNNAAITKAESDYDSQKTKLNYKESQLDVKMSDLDTERAEVETETTSVQKIIDKNIENSFKMFQNA